jgi:hypothetical protein
VERAIEKELKQESWRGSPVDLADLVDEIGTLVRGAHPESNKPRERGWVRLSFGGGDDLRFDGTAEFSEFARSGDSRLRDAKAVNAEIQGQPGDVNVRFWLARSAIPFFPTVSMTVSGRDGVVVKGVAEQAKKLLRRRGWWLRRSWLGASLWLVGFALIQLGWIDSPVFDWVSYTGAACMLAAAYAWFVEPYLLPRFEVLDPAAPQAGAARLRDALSGVGKWLLAATAGAVLYALAEKLING